MREIHKFDMNLAAFIVAILFATPVSAQNTTLISGRGVAVYANDLEADSQRLQPNARKTVLSVPETVRQAASNLYLRRVLASEAEREGLEKDPLVAATLRLLRDRVLSEVRLVQIANQQLPSDEAVEKLAEKTYKADTKRFLAQAETRAKHILIAGQNSQSREKAIQLLQRLKAGENFEALAKENSEDPASASKGGDLGYFPAGRMVPSFEEGVSKLTRPGQISDLVETQFGYHIIKLEARRPAGQKPFDEVKEELKAEVKSKLINDSRVALTEKILSDAVVDLSAISEFTKRARD
jgi:peptidyl-prolyl cis-trans isomerase C